MGHVRLRVRFPMVLLNTIAGMANSEHNATYAAVGGRIVSTFDHSYEYDFCPKLIVMPMGSFMMSAKAGGSWNLFEVCHEDAILGRREPGKINVIPSEHPRHRVEIDSLFTMARNEINHNEWMVCVTAGGC